LPGNIIEQTLFVYWGREKDHPMNINSKFLTIMMAVTVPVTLAGCATAEEAIGEVFAETQRASLSGTEVVSSSGDSDGSAQAEVSIANALDQICYDINNERNLAQITSVSLNRGQRGKTGPVVLRFKEANEGGWKNCVKKSEWLEDKLEWQPGNYYVQISTTEFPNGAIRGQLTR
jgi:flagellar hook-basal body complex protein FliE